MTNVYREPNNILPKRLNCVEAHCEKNRGCSIEKELQKIRQNRIQTMKTETVQPRIFRDRHVTKDIPCDENF